MSSYFTRAKDDLAYNERSFVEGKGHFVDDIIKPGSLHMSIVRSPYARARILSIKGGMTASDLGAKMASVGEGATEGENNVIQPVFATGYVNFVGEAVAAVFADDRYKSEDLLDSVEVEYEPLKPVVSIEDAMSSPPIHPGLKSNVISEGWRGKDFPDPSSPIVLEDVFMNNRIATNPIEPRGIVTDYDGKMLNVWVSTQSVHSIKEGLCEALRLNPDSVRVMQADTGGAFGSKGGLYPEYVIAAYASMKFRKPVKWIETRREHLSSTSHGRGAKGIVKIFAEKSGKITGLKGEAIVDAGAYGAGMGEFASRFIASMMTGPYMIENAHVKSTSVLTNKVTLGPYRGAGRPEASFFIERMVDKLADELKIDPVDLRILNSGDTKFKSPLGMEIDAARPFIEQAVKELDYRRKAKSTRNIGFSFFVLVPAFAPGETARVKAENGKISVWLGGNSHGQAHEVFVRKLVNEELGVPENLVTLYRGDTGKLQSGVGSWGSRSAMVGGAAVISACRKIKDEVTTKFGKYSTQLLLSGTFDAYVNEEQKGSLNSFGANLATVDIGQLGNVKVRDCAAYYDVGRALNMDMVIGQIQGGMAQGIGQTLHEEMAFNEDGQLLTSSISDAGVPLAEDIPNFEVKVAENPSRLPHGAKGLGESPTIGVPTALARAIERASGKRIRNTPIRPEDIL
ncbi:xanthine dehydrogenase subunit XdhA [Thermoplasmatales archaeon]|nr:xanthine dehydrogenase subunit XdhA [Thermoplasmatales archaeon]